MRGYYERSLKKTAAQVVEEFGPSLVGRIVSTVRIGDWPGGKARVIELAPDANAPDIVFRVEGIEGQNCNGDSKIGVFDYEPIEVVA